MLRDLVVLLAAVIGTGLCGGIVGCSKSGVSSERHASQADALFAPIVVQVENRRIASQSEASIRLDKLKHARLLRADPIKNSAAFATSESPIIASEVTFSRSSILNREFLFGSDLQYSSVGQGDGMLLQSMSIGHVVARFQIMGDRLQLMAEERYRFESDINIPLRLLHEWPIKKQTPDQLTVDIVTASPALGGPFGATNPTKTSWVRSVEFVENGSYLLIESSVELADGTVAEFMESVFPRATLVGKDPSPIYDDASLEPLAERFGFLSNPVWTTLPSGRVKTAVAQRFNVAPTDTINWYVTSNIPAEFLPAVRDGIEGWNRYSQKMWGRDFVKFMGVLPKEIKIGDPRYNVVNWDSVVDASSAYESQASDPETGIQSHSLIYLPYAWVKIGRDFWEKGELSQDRNANLKAALDRLQFLGKKVELPCFHEAELAAISLKMKEDPDAFSKELLRGVLFHEVGHSLGLAHNFKGSLQWNPDNATSPITSSIMDYNQYQLEGRTFDGAVGDAGPLLEYDRQILSVLYNGAKDLSKNDPVLPHCDDTGADSKAGGVDPLCLRYDAGQDPSVLLERTLQLIQDPAASLGKTKSLAAAASKVVEQLPDPASISDDLEVRMADAILRNQIAALTQYYVSAGAQGLNYMLSANLRNLAVFKAGTLPTGFDELAMRVRIAGAMDAMMTMEHFSAATRTKFEKIGDEAVLWLQHTAWYNAASPQARTERETAMRASAISALDVMEQAILPRVRVRQIASLARTATAPFFLTTSVDYEAKALGWIATVLGASLPSGKPYTTGERMAAATTLATFRDVPIADAIAAAARDLIQKQIAAATTAEEREALRALLKLL